MHAFRARPRVALLAATVAASLVPAAAARADITAPAPGSVQRGDVVIKDDRGALLGAGCLNLGTVKHTITITDAGGRVVYTRDTPGALTAGTGPVSATWSTDGVPDGTYEIASVAVDRIKPAGALTCQNVTTPLGRHSFTLRKWQHRFNDARGKGAVFMNTGADPELQFRVGDLQTGVIPGTGAMTVVSAPKGSGPLLPSDPLACLAAGGGCVPQTPPSCKADPGSCEERLVLINSGDDGWGLSGVFDLRSHAFTAVARIGERTEALGTVAPACGDAAKAAARRGLDLDRAVSGRLVLSLPVDAGSPREIRVTAADLCRFAETFAVETAASLTEAGGILGTPEAAAGLIVHFYVHTTSGSPSAPSALAYDISHSTLVPELPGLPALPALPELPELPVDGVTIPSLTTLAALAPKGPLTQVKGRGYDSGTHITGALNVDTAAGPEGYPVWLPVVTAGTKPDTAIDFAGYGTATQGQTCFTILGTETCVGIGAVAANGASIFGRSPLRLPLIR
jgi:hypothetical protein